MSAAIDLRRELHRHPELSGMETETAARIVRFFEPLGPDEIIRDLGGHGAAIVFSGAEPGPTVLLRSELDALPIRELSRSTHCSAVDGLSHACGHDGHMAVLAAVGEHLAGVRPRRGRVVLLYQPSEENGRGAEAVIADPRFSRIRPDFAFALHNLPGFPLGRVVLRSGTFSCASRGVVVSLQGTEAHASQPETGTSPVLAMCRVLELIGALPCPPAPDGEVAFATAVGARLGSGAAFGTAPGEARVLATLRAETDVTLDAMVAGFSTSVREIAAAHGLQHGIELRDEFTATVNSPRAVAAVRRAADEGLVVDTERPFPWSEDFGRFTARAEGAMFGIGAGRHRPELHNPAYDFPDELVPLGARVFRGIIRECLG